jgi:hypothetical protein
MGIFKRLNIFSASYIRVGLKTAALQERTALYWDDRVANMTRPGTQAGENLEEDKEHHTAGE